MCTQHYDRFYKQYSTHQIAEVYVCVNQQALLTDSARETFNLLALPTTF